MAALAQVNAASGRNPQGERDERYRSAERHNDAAKPRLERGPLPGNNEKGRESLVFRPIRANAVPKRSRILRGSGKIPYSAEQGINSAHQGSCSAANRDIWRMMRRLSGRLSRRCPACRQTPGPEAV
jgi:hypothetical protein